MQAHKHVHAQELMIRTFIQGEKGPCVHAE